MRLVVAVCNTEQGVVRHHHPRVEVKLVQVIHANLEDAI